MCDNMRQAKIFFFVMEIIINIICLSILPNQDKYKYSYITQLYQKQLNITNMKNITDITYYYEEEESLTEVKCISLAIIIVGSILCFFQLERIILYICYYKEKAIFSIISIFEIIFSLPNGLWLFL